MSLCVWLAVVGVVDLLRAARDATSRSRRALLVVIGVALLVLAGLSGGLTPTWWWSVALVWTVGLTAWVLTSSVALTAPPPPAPMAGGGVRIVPGPAAGAAARR